MCVHAIGGNVFCYFDLVRHVDWSASYCDGFDTLPDVAPAGLTLTG